MTTPKKNDKPKATQPDRPTPSEEVDETIELEDLRAEFLADLPALLPAHRFRISQRHAFKNLVLEAQKEKVFDRESMDYDLNNPEEIEAFQKLQDFIASIDRWAETIAINPTDYAAWAEGKTEEHFIVLFRVYRVALGESKSSSD